MKIQSKVQVRVQPETAAQPGAAGRAAVVEKKPPEPRRLVQGKGRVDDKTQVDARRRAGAASGEMRAQLEGKLPTYSKLQREAMDRLLTEGDVDRGMNGFVPESLRRTTDGRRLSKDAIALSISQGNSAEMLVIKDPQLGYFKQMAGGDPVPMTRAEIDKMKRNFEKQHPEDIDSPDQVDSFYKAIWNDLFPDKPVAMEH